VYFSFNIYHSSHDSFLLRFLFHITTHDCLREELVDVCRVEFLVVVLLVTVVVSVLEAGVVLDVRPAPLDSP